MSKWLDISCSHAFMWPYSDLCLCLELFCPYLPFWPIGALELHPHQPKFLALCFGYFTVGLAETVNLNTVNSINIRL